MRRIISSCSVFRIETQKDIGSYDLSTNYDRMSSITVSASTSDKPPRRRAFSPGYAGFCLFRDDCTPVPSPAPCSPVLKRVVPKQPIMMIVTPSAARLARGKILHTRNHKSEIPLEHTSENPLDNSSENPLGK